MGMVHMVLGVIWPLNPVSMLPCHTIMPLIILGDSDPHLRGQASIPKEMQEEQHFSLVHFQVHHELLTFRNLMRFFQEGSLCHQGRCQLVFPEDLHQGSLPWTQGLWYLQKGLLGHFSQFQLLLPNSHLNRSGRHWGALIQGDHLQIQDSCGLLTQGGHHHVQSFWEDPF